MSPKVFSALLQFLHTNGKLENKPSSSESGNPSKAKLTQPTPCPFPLSSELPYQLWEDSPSFVTYVRLYFVAERLGIGRLQHGMAVCVEGLSRHVAALAVAHRCPHCHPTRAKADQEEEGRHLASFLDAILVVEAHPWSARIVKAMYDAGDHMKARLARLPAFAEFVERSPQGKNFAKAIGAHHL